MAERLEAARRVVDHVLERERLDLAERWTVAHSGANGDVLAGAGPSR